MSDNETDSSQSTEQCSTGSAHRFQLNRHSGQVIEMEDIHFHFDSAVLMPVIDVEDSSTPRFEEGAITGLAVIRAALLHIEENPALKLVLVGHTDTTGSERYNRELSFERAKSVLQVLEGDRDGWKQTCRDRGKVEDRQQILKWLARNRGWPCDPGEIDDVDGPLTRDAVEAFQVAYNAEFDANISVDGDAGPQTFGAFFDCIEKQLKEILETDDAGLQAHRGQLQFVDDSRKAVGCGEHFPIEARGQDNYRSQRNRRVEILFFEAGEEPDLAAGFPSDGVCVPEEVLLYDSRYYRFEHVPVDPVPQLAWVDLQTVDELGTAVGDFTLLFTPDVGEPLEITTQQEGYWSGRIRAGARIRVTLPDETPVHYGSERAEGDSGTGEDTVIITPRVASRTVTDIVVPVAGEERVERRREIRRRYGPTRGGLGGRGGSRRGGVGDPDVGEPVGETSSRGGEDRRISRRTVGNAVADNLFIAAGWSDAQPNLDDLFDLLKAWLGDHHPTAIARGFLVEMILGNQILILDSNEREIGRFSLSAGASIAGRYGAHAPFEFFGVAGNMLFVDMQSSLTGLRGVDGESTDDGSEDEGGESSTEGAPPPSSDELPEGEDAGNEQSFRFIPEFVDESQREDYQRVVGSRTAARLVEVVYLVPGTGTGIHLARWGGTGYLEDYPGRGLDERIHARNLRVMENIKVAYDAYIDYYISQVEALPTNPTEVREGDPHPETQLHQLGPPESHYIFPRPAGISDSQYRELLLAGSTSALRAWRAITEKINAIFGHRSEGSVWVQFEFTAEAGEYAGPFSGCNVKLNFEADSEGRVEVTTPKTLAITARGASTGADGSETGSAGLTVEIDPDTGQEKTKANFAIGKYGLELDSTGNVKMSYGPVFSEANAITGVVGSGVELSIRDLVIRGLRRRGRDIPEWVERLPDLKAKIGVYARLITEGTVLRIVSNAPGFFEMRPRNEFESLSWNSLDYDEQLHLQNLGFDMESWESGTLPDAAVSQFVSLTPQQKISATRLPLPVRDPEWQSFWNAFSTRRRARAGG